MCLFDTPTFLIVHHQDRHAAAPFKSDGITKIAMAICSFGAALFGIFCIYEWIVAAGI
jgi:hypothetical protein